ncbi:Mss4-like protein [Mycena rebaudengoi]|nr:Mss4-like protein [Mycena rebaudengoi]
MSSIHSGRCFCGLVSYSFKGKPILSAYCHCTRCQAMTGSALIWTIHVASEVFSWTHSEPHDAALDSYVTEGKTYKTRYRCKRCGCCVSSYNSNTEHWSVFGPQLERVEGGEIKNLDIVKPTAHIFYGTRLVDVADELGKWEGYEETSSRIQ